MPTRVFQNSKTTIDLLFSNSDKLITNHEVVHCDISDHFAITLTLQTKRPKSQFSYISKRDFCKLDKIEFFERASYIDFHSTEELRCAHEAARFLEEKIEIIVDQFAPFKTQKLHTSSSAHWRSKELSRHITLKRKAFNSFIDSGCEKSSVEWQIYRKIRNKVSNLKRDAKKAAMSKILYDTTITQWQKIKIFKGDNSLANTKISELEVDGIVYNDDCSIAEQLNSYFSTIGLKLNAHANAVASDTMNGVLNGSQTLPFQQFSFQQVTNSDVSSVLHSLKSRKNGGVSQIPAFVYKILEPLILNPLTHIINLSLKDQVFPDIWKQALVIPIYKGGQRNLPGNYRPISLLPILSKVLEKIMSSQIRDYIDIHGLIASRQFGFRKGVSTDQIILQLVDKIRNLINQPSSKFVTLAALDVKKAFDCVHHLTLKNKLKDRFNFSQTATNLIQNYLSNRQQIMKVNGTISPKTMVSTGVPQGSVLGPLLFIIFINDLMYLDNCYLFADDCLLLTNGPSAQCSSDAMEGLLSTASKWYDHNRLVLNAAKTDVMTISNQALKDYPKLKFNDLLINQSNKIKYLGVILDNKLNLRLNVSRIKQKLFPVVSNFSRNRKYLNPKLAVMWYTGLIRPHIEYCAALNFSAHQYIVNELLKIENRCLKIIQYDQPKDATRSNFVIPKLTSRLKYLYLLTFFKLIHQIVPIIDPDILPAKLSSQTRLAKNEGMRVAKFRSKFSIAGYGTAMYNKLPPHITACLNLKQFKTSLISHILLSDTAV